MTWSRLFGSPVFVIGALVVILALTGAIEPVAMLVAQGFLAALNILIVPLVLLGFVVYAFKVMFGGGSGGKGRK